MVVNPIWRLIHQISLEAVPRHFCWFTAMAIQGIGPQSYAIEIIYCDCTYFDCQCMTLGIKW